MIDIKQSAKRRGSKFEVNSNWNILPTVSEQEKKTGFAMLNATT